MKLLRALSLGVTLYALWLLLSGHYVPLLLTLGAGSVVAIILIARRMNMVNGENQPVNLRLQSIPYFGWLIWEIIKANIDVALAIIRPGMPINPAILMVTGSQKSELGRVIYANSITLTPGTVTIELAQDKLCIHALTVTAAEGLATGDMDRRVTAIEKDDA